MGEKLFSIELPNPHVYMTFSKRLWRIIGVDPKCMTNNGTIGNANQNVGHVTCNAWWM